MRAPKNRKVFVVGYGVATPLGRTLESTWARAVRGEAGFRKVTRCEVDSPCYVVGEIPDWDPEQLDFATKKDVYNWNAQFVHLTMAVCRDALTHAGLAIDDITGPRTACLIGSALNGVDSFKAATHYLLEGRPSRISPYLLPNLCGNLPGGKAGMLLGFTGLNVSPQGACASGNHGIGLGARMIRDGDLDFALAGGVDTPIVPEIIHGFHNMNATIKVREGDRAFEDPTQASRPYSKDRRGFVLSEGAGVVVLAAQDVIRANGLQPLAEVLGVGWTSDAYHITKPSPPTIIRAIRMALEDADLQPEDIEYVNGHGTSTPRGDEAEVTCLREVFGDHLAKMPISSNKSQLGHTLGGSAGIEAALTIESMRQKILLPTVNHIPDPAFADVDVIPNEARKQATELVLSNAFGFGGTNCCVVFRGT
ncbi:MAG: beta-ketoacyl-[acyl-carrier-protein] synthase family protein [bacterium]